MAKTTREKNKHRGMGSIFQRPGTPYWYIQYSWHGKVFRESSESEKYEVAERLLKSKIAEISQEKFVPSAGKVTVGELLDDLLAEYKRNPPASLPSIESSIRLHLKPILGTCKVKHFGTKDLGRYIDKRLAEEAAPGKVNVELSYLRRAFTVGQEATPPKVGNIPKFKLLKLDNIRKGFFEKESLDKLLAYLPAALKGPTLLGYWTGMRKEEILSLRWTQVDWFGQVVRLDPGTTKNNEGRVIPFNPELKALLEAQRGASEQWVFPSPEGERLSLTGTNWAWNQACVKAGLGKYTIDKDGGEHYSGMIFHDLRRTGVRNLIRAGVPEAIAMKISGHKTRSVFDRYNIVDERDLHRAMDMVSKAQCANTVYTTPKEEPKQETETLSDQAFRS